MALVCNCNEDVVTAAFISELQVTYSFYKHLVKNNVTKMRNILVWVQKYMQIEEATQTLVLLNKDLRARSQRAVPPGKI